MKKNKHAEIKQSSIRTHWFWSSISATFGFSGRVRGPLGHRMNGETNTSSKISEIIANKLCDKYEYCEAPQFDKIITMTEQKIRSERSNNNHTFTKFMDSIYNGKWDNFANIIKRNKIDFETGIHKYNYYSPLMLAVERNEIDMVKLLLKYKVQVNNNKLVNWAADHDINIYNLILPIVIATGNGNYEIFKLLHKNNNKTNYLSRDQHKSTLLHISIEKKYHIISNHIIISCDGKLLESRDKEGNTPLSIAVKCMDDEKCVNIIKLLLDKKVKINSRNRYGNTAMIELAMNYRANLETLKSCYQLMIKFNPKLEITNKRGITAKIKAKSFNKKLIEFGYF